jgi:hypothetical protein
MGLDSAEELSGYDEVDSDQVFNGGYLSDPGKGGMGGEGRRRGKKTLSPRGTHRSRPKRFMGIFSFNFRGFEDTAKMMLAVSIGALALCAILLYATFGMHLLPDFYGALAASIVVMALLFYTASRLIGGNR